jgi:predicted nucleic acid-binding protein
MPKVVSNSSILIHLGKIGLLDVLRAEYGVIWIPEAVWREVVVEGSDEKDAQIIT